MVATRLNLRHVRFGTSTGRPATVILAEGPTSPPGGRREQDIVQLARSWTHPAGI
jgi:hypothetical protein